MINAAYTLAYLSRLDDEITRLENTHRDMCAVPSEVPDRKRPRSKAFERQVACVVSSDVAQHLSLPQMCDQMQLHIQKQVLRRAIIRDLTHCGHVSKMLSNLGNLRDAKTTRTDVATLSQVTQALTEKMLQLMDPDVTVGRLREIAGYLGQLCRFQLPVLSGQYVVPSLQTALHQQYQTPPPPATLGTDVPLEAPSLFGRIANMFTCTSGQQCSRGADAVSVVGPGVTQLPDRVPVHTRMTIGVYKGATLLAAHHRCADNTATMSADMMTNVLMVATVMEKSSGDSMSYVQMIMVAQIVYTLLSRVWQAIVERYAKHTTKQAASLSFKLGNEVTNATQANVMAWLDVHYNKKYNQMICERGVQRILKDKWAWMPLFEPQHSVDITYEGQTITIAPPQTVAQSTAAEQQRSVTNARNAPAAERVFVLAGPSVDLLRSFVEECRQFNAQESKTKRRVKFTWDVPHRRWLDQQFYVEKTKKSVFFEDKEALFEDVTNFLTKETLYKEKGIPFKRGYLLAGLPGTGKTSLANAISQHFNMSCYIAPNTSSPEEMRLALSSIPPKSVVFFDDIDTKLSLGPRSGAEYETSGVSGGGNNIEVPSNCVAAPQPTRPRRSSIVDIAYPSAMLNVMLEMLDGYDVLHHCIVLVATNHPEKLDPAVLRHGRLDMHLYMNRSSDAVLSEIFMFFFPEHAHEIQHRDRVVFARCHMHFVSATVINSFILPAFKSNNTHAYRRALTAMLEQIPGGLQLLRPLDNPTTADSTSESSESPVDGRGTDNGTEGSEVSEGTEGTEGGMSPTSSGYSGDRFVLSVCKSERDTKARRRRRGRK